MRLASASSPDAIRRIPERFLPADPDAASWPSRVAAEFASASLRGLSTCRGSPAQPDRISNAAARADPILRIRTSYQAHFAPMHHPRRIRSFVLRAGRTTAAQERALAQLWPVYGLDTGAHLDLDSVFGRPARRCLEIGFGSGEVIGQLAEQHPETDYLGIEVHKAGVGRLLLRAQQA